MNEVPEVRQIGIISSRIAGVDGVSLEIGKWADILERMGYACYYVAGACDRDEQRSWIIPEADICHPIIADINQGSFGRRHRSQSLGRQIEDVARKIKDQLYAAVDEFHLDMIVAENVLTLPMNIPLGVAVLGLVIETGIPCIAHHHDFVWERERFRVNAVRDYIASVFPPRLSEIQHVVINSLAGEEFSRRTGLSCRVIPNVMDFANPPAPLDDYARGFRNTIGLADDDLLILQPTRVVQRKGIEHSVELVRRLDDSRCKLVITHTTDDEGDDYADHIREYAYLMGVEVIFADQYIAHCRQRTDWRKCYSIWDVYQQADLVTYPSTYEGFGNAFLEAIYFRKPIFCNRYAIYRTDIEPCGFETITMDGFVTGRTVEAVRRVLHDAECRKKMVDHNYQVAQRFFSYDRVEHELRSILSRPKQFICDS
jgi:glycosyltransferase involved in cell wall biosynthesis